MTPPSGVVALLPEARCDAMGTALAFRKAIVATVNPGDIVVVTGTGVGQLAGFTVAAGAARVHVVERDPVLASRLRLAVALAERDDVVTVAASELHQVVPARAADVVVSDVLDLEPVIRTFLPDLARLALRGAIDRQTRLIPSLYEVRVELVGEGESNDAVTAIAGDVAIAAGNAATRAEPLTFGVPAIAADSSLFSGARTACRFDTHGRADGLATAARITHRTHLAPGVALAAGSSPDRSELLRLPVPIAVRRGSAVTCRVRLDAGAIGAIDCWRGG
jgi:hypothetical protein